MELLPISIGQAGNQINFELSSLFKIEDFKTINGDLVKNILIDTEKKVIGNYFTKNNKLADFYAEGVNVITNSSGRGNNWALGYSVDFKEGKGSWDYEGDKNISLESVEKINKFLEKCEFLKGFLFIHSLNGGTGSGVTSRIIEILKDDYPKFKFVDCPVIGMNSKLNNFYFDQSKIQH
jgi:hypothetical protein